MNIYKKRYYLVATTPGTSGFQRWNELELRFVSGYKARNCKTDVVAEFLPEKVTAGLSKISKNEIVRFEDGHLPEFQPKIVFKNINTTIRQQPYNLVFWKTIDKADLYEILDDQAFLKFV